MGAFNKILGGFMILFGIFLVKWFPSIAGYDQPKSMSWAGITLGIPCMYIGVYLVLH